ncbi:hypothetical protein DYBT9275_02289 [Dyadobacter sp. CECT 9275]|uniref:Uncharacterized protein n=2 Tax=Dyadobacter helix TaxID=2822344 RepID=A0A916JBK1_9BACT|nr:hypothetical protein DYBT9275_02289 [Dyadobacter sp. CECT 9275]
MDHKFFQFRLEEFYYMGFTVIEDVLTNDVIINLRNEVERIYLRQEKEFTSDRLKLINEQYVCRALLSESEAYLKLASNEFIISFVKAILGDYFILHLQNGIINMPGEYHHQSNWH